MIETGLAIGSGFLLLVLGGGALVRGAVSVAERLGLSKLLIGLVLVGFGTSMPELATSVNAALAGSPRIAIGNVVGSNIANTLLILGLTATIFPIACDPKAFKRDGPALIVATLAFAVVGFSGTVGRLSGILFLTALLVYVAHTYRAEHRQADASAQLHAAESTLAEPGPRPLWLGLLFFVAGTGIVVAGADLLVDGAVELARGFGISETIIGLTLVAVGTSLPELAASSVAAFRRHTDIAFGNIVGSNLFNILGILGVTAVITPLPVPPGVLSFDLWVLLAVTALLIVFAMTRWVLSRLEGLVFMAGYLGYLVFLAIRAGDPL